MKGSLPVIAVFLCLALLSACKKNVQNDDAIRQGILNYLSKRGDLNAMDVSVTSVSYHDNQATATVHFQAKGNTAPAAGLNLEYVLDRQGNDWIVKGKAGSSNHGAEGMPGPGAGSPTGALPPGHPSVAPDQSSPSVPGGLPPLPQLPNQGQGNGSSALPPGHPSVNPNQGQNK